MQAAAAAIGTSRHVLGRWIRGEEFIPDWAIGRLIELARQQSAALAALAVRLETVDRPVLRERKRLVRLRKREAFKARFGYLPEENQVLKQRPPSS